MRNILVQDTETVKDNEDLFSDDDRISVYEVELPEYLPDEIYDRLGTNVTRRDLQPYTDALNTIISMEKSTPIVDQKVLNYLRQLRENPSNYVPSVRNFLYKFIIEYISDVKKEYWKEAVELIPEKYYPYFTKTKYYKPAGKRSNMILSWQEIRDKAPSSKDIIKDEGRIWFGEDYTVNLNSTLFEKLVPETGEAATPHGELLREINRIYYDYMNNGFGNGPHKIEAISEYREKIKEYLSTPQDYHKFIVAFKGLNYGARSAPDEWRGERYLEAVTQAIVLLVRDMDLTA